MNETTKVNFNNPDGSFNRDKWLDFMNTSIQSIPYINTWTGHTVGLVNKQTKEISWSGSSCNRDKFISSSQTNSIKYEKWDINNGWEMSIALSNFIKNPTDKIEIFKVYDVAFGSGQNIKFVVVYPNGQWRFLGYWEYAQYGFKKYIPYKIQEQLKKLGVL